MSNGSAGVGGLKSLKALVWIVYAIAIAASVVLAFGFFLLMFDASPTAGFAEFIYTTSMRFAGPFVGMIEPTQLSNGGVVAWSALFAIVAYLILAWIVSSILDAIGRSIYRKSRPAPAAVQPYAPQPMASQPAAVPEPQPAPEPAPAAAPEPETAAAEPQAEGETPAPEPESAASEPEPAAEAAPVAATAEPEAAPPAEAPKPTDQPPA